MKNVRQLLLALAIAAAAATGITHAQITVPDVVPRIEYTATSGQTVFDYTFKLLDESHLTVSRVRDGTQTTLTLATDYTVSGVGDSAGGEVTLTSGSVEDDTIVILRSVPFQRDTEYTTAGDFRATTVNRDQDLQTMMIQELARDLSVSFRFDPAFPGATIPPLTLSAADRAERFLAFDAAGDPVVSTGATTVTPGSIGTLELADEGVTQPKLAKPAVGTPEIIDLSVTTAKLAAAAVTLAKQDSTARPISCSLNVLTASGTWTRPANLAYVVVRLVGGGGGGAGAPATGAGEFSFGRPGAGAGYCEKRIAESALGATETVTIGAAGAAGSAGAAGGAGGTTSFGAHCSGNGGGAGVVQGASSGSFSREGPAGGTATGGDINVPGKGGGMSMMDQGTIGFGGIGGDSVLGHGGRGSGSAGGGGNGEAGTGFGSGGGGEVNAASQSARVGRAGAPGIVVVEECVHLQ